MSNIANALRIDSRIQQLRGLRVMIDADLAELYGVPTKALNQAVKRNIERFPSDFMFQLTSAEKAEVVTNCDHLKRLKFSKALPFAFTEYGAFALSSVLTSPQAVQMGIYVVRAFVRLRELALSNQELTNRLDDLQAQTEQQAFKQDAFANITRRQLKEVFDTLRLLTNPPDPPKRPIGFVTDQSNK